MKYAVKLSQEAEGVQAGRVAVDNAENLFKLLQTIPTIVRCIQRFRIDSAHDFPGSVQVLKLLQEKQWATMVKKLTRMSFYVSTFGFPASPGYDITVRVHTGSKQHMFFQLFYEGSGYKGLWLHGFDDGTNF